MREFVVKGYLPLLVCVFVQVHDRRSRPNSVIRESVAPTSTQFPGSRGIHLFFLGVWGPCPTDAQG